MRLPPPALPPFTISPRLKLPSATRIQCPVSPNSLLFDLAGDKIIMGSDFGAQIIIPGNFGGSSSAFTSLGSITGRALATSNTGAISLFSDTLHTPNQLYVVSTGNTGSVPTTALNISNATVAAFSPDSLKAYIVGRSRWDFALRLLSCAGPERTIPAHRRWQGHRIRS